MFCQIVKLLKSIFSFIIISASLFLPHLAASEAKRVSAGNFGLPGIIDLPTALRFPDGELVITQQLHKSLARSGISFQALPRVGVSFRYTGHGVNGGEAYGRVNHDRSFDAHISVTDEGRFFPAISLGLRDFIGRDGTRRSISLALSQSVTLN